MKSKKIKLTKEEKAEGLTDEMVDAVDMLKQSSPVQLLPGDEPQKLMRCLSGFWVRVDDGDFLRDVAGRIIIFSMRECIVGRARYLKNFPNSK